MAQKSQIALPHNQMPERVKRFYKKDIKFARLNHLFNRPDWNIEKQARNSICQQVQCIQKADLILIPSIDRAKLPQDNPDPAVTDNIGKHINEDFQKKVQSVFRLAL